MGNYFPGMHTAHSTLTHTTLSTLSTLSTQHSVLTHTPHTLTHSTHTAHTTHTHSAHSALAHTALTQTNTLQAQPTNHCLNPWQLLSGHTVLLDVTACIDVRGRGINQIVYRKINQSKNTYSDTSTSYGFS
jgi:hypothetical protein